MKNTKLILNFLSLFIFEITGLYAQETISATGGDATGTGGSVSFTVGQTFYTTDAGTNASVAQGVQQPFEISVVTGIEEAKGINLVCSAYPNPTTNLLTLKVDGYKTDNLNYLLFDLNGKSLENKKVTGNETSISMEKFQPGTYFLKVTDKNKEIKTLKIIKTQ
jgi:hypothetical protein